MNQPLPVYPRFTQPSRLVPEGLRLSPGLRHVLEDQIMGWVLTHLRELTQDLQLVHGQINSAVQGVGDDLPSGPSITPTNPIHVVTGSSPISKIVAPLSFSGPLWLIPDGTWKLVVTAPPDGNIARAVQASPGEAVLVVYDYRTTLWYPLASGIGPSGGGNLETWIPIDGTDFHVSNPSTSYPSPVQVTLGSNGAPLAVLTHRDVDLPWSPTDPPPSGYWTLTPAQDIHLGDSTEQGDYLAYKWAAAAA